MDLNIFAVFQDIAGIVLIGAQSFLVLANGNLFDTTLPSRNS